MCKEFNHKRSEFTKMRFLESLWRKLTETKALKEASEFETAFFENVFRLVYIVGLSSSDGGLYLIYSNIVKLSIILFICSELAYLVLSSEGLDSIIANISVTLIHLIAKYRFDDMMKHQHIYKRLARSMESGPHFDVSTKRRKDIVAFWVNHSTRYFKLCLTLGSCTLAAWYIYPFVDDVDYNLVVTLEIPFDYQTPYLYLPTYIVVLFAFQFISYFVMTNDIIMQAHLMHLLCQYSILSDCFENIIEDCAIGFSGTNPDTLVSNPVFIDRYTDRLRDLVEQHQYILRNTLELKRILSTPMLGQLASSSILICFAGYQVTATVTDSIAKFLMSCLYLGYNMFELFIFCRWCDEIKMQSEYIREAVYFSGWEAGLSSVPGVRRRLMIIIARASQPLVLTAGGLYDLSLNSYATLVKTSYSALTMLLRIRRN